MDAATLWNRMAAILWGQQTSVLTLMLTHSQQSGLTKLISQGHHARAAGTPALQGVCLLLSPVLRQCTKHVLHQRLLNEWEACVICSLLPSPCHSPPATLAFFYFKKCTKFPPCSRLQFEIPVPLCLANFHLPPDQASFSQVFHSAFIWSLVIFFFTAPNSSLSEDSCIYNCLCEYYFSVGFSH